MGEDDAGAGMSKSRGPYDHLAQRLSVWSLGWRNVWHGRTLFGPMAIYSRAVGWDRV